MCTLIFEGFKLPKQSIIKCIFSDTAQFGERTPSVTTKQTKANAIKCSGFVFYVYYCDNLH